MNTKTLSLLAASTLSVWLLTSASNADIFPVDAKGPDAIITTMTGTGTDNAKVTAAITKQSVIDWCDNWKPGDKSCFSDMSGSIGETFSASANCNAGSMTDPNGDKYKWAGLNRGNDWDRFYLFKDTKTGENVGFSNANGGVRLMAQWMTLCPYGLPYSELPQTTLIDPNLEYPRLRDRGIVQMSELATHNGSLMSIDPDLGIITYHNPKYKSIKQNTVLFRGSISFEYGVPTRGMAYVFKSGCEPQPYAVSGLIEGDRLTLEGKAPIWDGCNVKSYTSKSKNAKLIFDFVPR